MELIIDNKIIPVIESSINLDDIEIRLAEMDKIDGNVISNITDMVERFFSGEIQNVESNKPYNIKVTFNGKEYSGTIISHSK
jgi:hypothetical protein